MVQYHSFDNWKILVNVQLVKLCGMHADDLPDYDYRNAYNRNMSPAETAKKALRNAKKDMGL